MCSVAVVILNYNSAGYLQDFLPTTIEHSKPHRVIVADNCSSDNSLEILKQYPYVETIAFDKNHGYAGGYNKALEKIQSKYYILLNSDVEVSEGWISPLLSFLEGNEGYACAQPKILSYFERDKFEYAGAAGGFIDKLGYPYCRGRLFDTTEQDHGQYDQDIDIFWTSGACMMIRSDIFHKAGGLTPVFCAHGRNRSLLEN